MIMNRPTVFVRYQNVKNIFIVESMLAAVTCFCVNLLKMDEALSTVYWISTNTYPRRLSY